MLLREQSLPDNYEEDASEVSMVRRLTTYGLAKPCVTQDQALATGPPNQAPTRGLREYT